MGWENASEQHSVRRHHHEIRFWKVIFIAIVLVVILTLPLD